MPTTFELITECSCPPEALFDASLSIDAHVDSMAASRERAVAGVTRGRIGLGETVTWRARHLGLWFRMTSQVTVLDRPRRFVDEQVRGPFRSFVHEHEFTDDGGTTRMTDRFTVAAPVPVLGRLVERSVLVPYLRRVIRTRNEHLVALVER